MVEGLKVLVVLGTRAEAIKLAPIILDLRRRSGINVMVCLTGQHRHMVDPVLSWFDIPVDDDLQIMVENQSLAHLTATVLTGMDRVLDSFHPAWILVQGDTTSAFAASLAGFYRRIPVAHVEAGLRSYQKQFPFPEEVNRILTTHLSDVHFAPTQQARANLLKEGIPGDRVQVVGNPVIDALMLTVEKTASEAFHAQCQARLATVDWGKRVLLVTGHRRESFGAPFGQICEALRDLALTEDVEIIYPVHLNPNVQRPVYQVLGGLRNVHLLEPVDYPMLIWLAQQSFLIITDSGGIQEEAPSLGKPVVVMRDVTERCESLEAGVAVLVGTSRATIVETVTRLLHDPEQYQTMARVLHLYGDGNAAKRIGDCLENGVAVSQTSLAG